PAHSAVWRWGGPVRASMRGIACAGAMRNPWVNTSTAATSQSTRRARGTEPGRRLSPAPVATHRPAAPSVSGDEFPAVIVPLPLFLSKAGCSFARRSGLVSVRGKPSRDMPSTGTIRSSKNPDFVVDLSSFGREPRDWLLAHDFIPADLLAAWKSA